MSDIEDLHNLLYDTLDPHAAPLIVPPCPNCHGGLQVRYQVYGNKIGIQTVCEVCPLRMAMDLLLMPLPVWLLDRLEAGLGIATFDAQDNQS